MAARVAAIVVAVFCTAWIVNHVLITLWPEHPLVDRMAGGAPTWRHTDLLAATTTSGDLGQRAAQGG